ncbi:MAG: SGNH/GDSL hydrolase family protein [Rhizobiaceae bacterium]
MTTAALPLRSITAATLLFGTIAPAATAAESAAPCRVPFDVVRLAYPLPHVKKRLDAKQPVTIVAIGSSSTAGSGASTPDASYPSRLKVELTRLLPDREFKIINRGVGGEEIKDMLRRFDRDVVEAKPDLVLWQLGTNSLIRDHPISDEGVAIRDGIERARKVGADIVLIDPQFAPKVNAKEGAAEAVEVIGMVGKLADVGVFRRYELMRRWRVIDGMSFADFVSPDGLHMNDWSYACVARALAVAVAEAATKRPSSATARVNTR